MDASLWMDSQSKTRDGAKNMQMEREQSILRTSTIWEISGNFWLKDNLLDDASAAGVGRGVLLLSQANYFAARACFRLANEGFSQLGIKSLPKRFLETARKGEVPSWWDMADYLPKAIESLQGIPDRNGPVVLTKHRESVIRSISAYVDCVRKVTPLRNAICHGVLTKDDDFDTVLHPTDGANSFVLWKRVPMFVQLSHNAYNAAASLDANLLMLGNYVGCDFGDMTLYVSVEES